MSKNTYMAPDTQVLSLAPGGGAILTGSQQNGSLGNMDPAFGNFDWE